MNRSYHVASKFSRSLFACAAVFASVLVLAAISRLAEECYGGATPVAATAAVVAHV